MPFANTLDILKGFGSNVIRKSKIALGATRDRTRRRSTWTKDGQLKSSQKVKYKGKISSSGNLKDSLEYTIKKTQNSISILFKMNDYGIYIDQGRKPGNVKRGVIAKYTKTKPLRVREMKDGKLGGFAKNTKSNRDGMNFMISRKIKHFGIEKTEFFTENFDEFFKVLPKEIQNALVKDILVDFNYGES